jgi:hypothetical protein
MAIQCISNMAHWAAANSGIPTASTNQALQSFPGGVANSLLRWWLNGSGNVSRSDTISPSHGVGQFPGALGQKPKSEEDTQWNNSYFSSKDPLLIPMS